MKRLSEDLPFLDRTIAEVRAAGVMRHPRFDEDASELVDGGLRIDLLNVWHATRQLAHPATDEIMGNWARPKHLGHACSFGRIDVVQRSIEADRPVDGSDYGGNPIAAAIEAWVVTPLHVRCAEMLFAAGAEATVEQLDAFSAESTGSANDVALLAVLLEHARRSGNPEVRARADAWATSPASGSTFSGIARDDHQHASPARFQKKR